MKRRDTIIIAVLVNAALLLVLFTTALRSDKKKEAKSEISELSLPSKTTETPLTTEELLNEYIASTTANPGEEILELAEMPQPIIASNPPVTNNSLTQAPALPLNPVVQENVTSVIQPAPSIPVVAAPTITPMEKEQVVEVTVKKGDCLDKIARTNNSTVNAIMQASNLSSTQLKIGQVLKVPVVKGKEASKDPVVATVDNDFYVVKEGDSPWAIANKCHVKLDDLLRLNNIDDQKAKKLKPGDKLRIR